MLGTCGKTLYISGTSFRGMPEGLHSPRAFTATAVIIARGGEFPHAHSGQDPFFNFAQVTCRVLRERARVELGAAKLKAWLESSLDPDTAGVVLAFVGRDRELAWV